MLENSLQLISTTQKSGHERKTVFDSNLRRPGILPARSVEDQLAYPASRKQPSEGTPQAVASLETLAPARKASFRERKQKSIGHTRTPLQQHFATMSLLRTVCCYLVSMKVPRVSGASLYSWQIIRWSVPLSTAGWETPSTTPVLHFSLHPLRHFCLPLQYS